MDYKSCGDNSIEIVRTERSDIEFKVHSFTTHHKVFIFNCVLYIYIYPSTVMPRVARCSQQRYRAFKEVLLVNVFFFWVLWEQCTMSCILAGGSSFQNVPTLMYVTVSNQRCFSSRLEYKRTDNYQAHYMIVQVNFNTRNQCVCEFCAMITLLPLK